MTPPATITILVRRAFVGDGGEDWFVGTTHDASARLAREMIAIGAAVAVVAAPAAPPLTTAVQHADPKPSRRR